MPSATVKINLSLNENHQVNAQLLKGDMSRFGKQERAKILKEAHLNTQDDLEPDSFGHVGTSTTSVPAGPPGSGESPSADTAEASPPVNPVTSALPTPVPHSLPISTSHVAPTSVTDDTASPSEEATPSVASDEYELASGDEEELEFDYGDGDAVPYDEPMPSRLTSRVARNPVPPTTFISDPITAATFHNSIPAPDKIHEVAAREA